jgi:hypothetical protein
MGIFIDTCREHWAVHGPQYYLMAQLTWDPFKDGRAVLKDYYQRGFGNAAGKIEAYWNLMEEAREKVSEGFSGEELHISVKLEKVYNEDFFQQAENLIQQSEVLVTNEPEKYRKRVDFVKTGLKFTRLMISNLPVMARVRKSGGKDSKAVEIVDKNWETIKKLSESAGPVAFNYDQLMWGVMRGNMNDYFGPVSEIFRKASGENYKSVDEARDNI